MTRRCIVQFYVNINVTVSKNRPTELAPSSTSVSLALYKMTTELATKRLTPSRTHFHIDTTALSEGISRKRETHSEGSKRVVASFDALKPTSEEGDSEIEISGPFPLSLEPESTQIVPRTGLKHAVVQQAATTSLNIVTNGSTAFEEDFIPFVFSDPSDDKPGPSRRRRTDRTNERERETEKNSDGDDITGRQLSERQAISNSDLNEVPTSGVKGKSKMPVSEREWDREKEAVADDKYDRRNGHGRNRKRKYEEYDDGHSNQKQRMEVGSRKCPWVADLDLNRCTNVAEM